MDWPLPPLRTISREKKKLPADYPMAFFFVCKKRQIQLSWTILTKKLPSLKLSDSIILDWYIESIYQSKNYQLNNLLILTKNKILVILCKYIFMLHYASVIFGSAVDIVMNRQGDHCCGDAGGDEEVQ